MFRAIALFAALLLPAAAGPGGEPTVTPFPPDGQAQLIVADGWAYIVRGTPPVPVRAWQFADVPPDPQPDPQPDPPLPGEKWQVVIVFERMQLDNLPWSQRTIIGSLVFRERLKEAGHRLVAIVDQHVEGTDGKPPQDLAAYLNACKGDPVPRICLAPLKGGPVRDFPLPQTEDEVFALLEKGDLP